MKSILSICFSFISLVYTSAQEIEPDSVVFLDELVVSANKIVEPRSKLSQQIQVIDAADIKTLNAQSTADLLLHSGVVGMQKSQQGGGSAQLRGFEASRVVLMVDGVRMNNLIYRAGHLQNIITIDNTMLDRVEVLLGPSSTVYGSDALGGVISMRTKDPVMSTTGKPSVSGNGFYRYGTVNNEKTAHIDVNLGFKKVALLFGATISDFGDLTMGKKPNPAFGQPFGLRYSYVERAPDNSGDTLVANKNPYVQRNSGYTQRDLIGKILLRRSDRISHMFNVQYSTSSDIPRYDRLTDPDGAGLRQAEWYYGPQQRMMIAYELQAPKTNTWMAGEMKALISYQAIQESRHDRRFNRPNRRNQMEDVDVIGVNIDFVKTFARHALRYGVDAQFNYLQSSAFNVNVATGDISPVATRYPAGNNVMHYLAVYATDAWDVSKKVTFNSGIRIGRSQLRADFSDKSFFQFPFETVDQSNEYGSGNVGIAFRPTGAWKFSLMISTGYRVPNIDDLAKVFETSAGSSLVVPNPDVRPEKTVNLDLAVTSFISDKLRWENNVFFTSFFDAIVLDRFTFAGDETILYNGQQTPVFANQNKREAVVMGWSSVLTAQLSSVLSLNGSYNLTKGKIVSDEDKPLDHIPPAFGRVEFKYRSKKTEASLFSNFNGWKKIEDYFLNSEDNEIYATPQGMPSWYTINFRAGYQYKRFIGLQFGIDNILDLQYRTFASGINAPGRNFFGTLRFLF